jgi:diguanylate cyclase (GGDEF)-like protein
MTLENPSLLLTTLDNFSPDLVLLDLYFADCNGIEVAKIIRQDNKFTDLSIVFLSGEAEESVQLIAMQSGADDFLHKPIDEKVLVKAISTRILRFRALRELTRQDRMTGLLNQIAFQLQLEFEISRIHRSDLPLSVVVLDIDKFKEINDGYGHPVGDAVIKSLARLLKKRLRRTDIIGRLGGDEFGIIMTDTPLDKAVKVLDELRVEFTKLRHVGLSNVFNCTFSAGVADLEQAASINSIMKAADEALYVSKQLGRNRVSQYVSPAST